MDFIGLVTWPGLQGCEEKDIKAQKILFWVLFLNKDSQPNVVTNQGYLSLYHLLSFSESLLYSLFINF